MTDGTRAEDEALALMRADGFGRCLADDTQPQTDVDKVIDQLDRRVIGAPERTKLRGALDKADKPDTSRTGQDAAVGRALRIASVDELSAKIQKIVAAASPRETR